MSERQSGFVYRDNLAFDEQLRDQIRVCRFARNEGMSDVYENAIEMLENLVTEGLVDKRYVDEKRVLEEEFKSKEEALLREWRESRKRALCPDVLERPDLKGDLGILDKRFCIVLALAERQGLLLRGRFEDEL